MTHCNSKGQGWSDESTIRLARLLAPTSSQEVGRSQRAFVFHLQDLDKRKNKKPRNGCKIIGEIEKSSFVTS